VSAYQSRPTATPRALKLALFLAAIPIAAFAPSALASPGGTERVNLASAGDNATPGAGPSGRGGSDERQQQNWFYGQRAYPYRTIAPGLLLHAQRQAQITRHQLNTSGAAAASTAPTAALNWSPFGPRPITAGEPSYFNGAAPWSGRVTAIAHHPTNAKVAYLGAADGGVWKTTDSGLHWNPIFDSVGGGPAPSLAIGSIAVDPQNPKIVYVGTGEPNSNNDSYFGAGIFRSVNGGSSWSKIGGSTFDNCYVSNIVVQPGSSSTIFVGIGGPGRYQTSCQNGIWRKTASTSWTRLISGRVSDLVSKPGSPNTWYAGFTGFGVWRSTQDGDNGSWSQLAGGLPTSNLGRVDLAVTPDNPSRLYAAIENSTNNKALGTWTSTNSGTSWTPLPYTDYCSYKDGDPSGQCFYDLSAAAYPTNQASLYVGGVRLRRYDGSSWTTLGYDGVHSGAGFIHVDFHSVSFDAKNRLWVGTDGGAYRKEIGSPFTNLNGTLDISQFYPGTSGSPSTLFLGGTQDNGSLQYTPSSGWYELETGDGGYTAYDASHAYKFTTYIHATVNRDPGGQCLFSAFYSAGCNKIVAEPSLFIAPLVRSPSDPATLFVGTDRIWKTTNDGSNWTAESDRYSVPNGDSRVSALAQAPSNSSVLYAGWSGDPTYHGQGGSVFALVSKNANAATPDWSATDTLPDRFITDIAVKQSAPKVAWVTLSGYNTGHVFLTQNFGGSWTDISGNLPNAPVNGIAVDSRTSPSTLYVATDVGIFWSTDGGSTWANTSTGLPNSVVMDIRVVPATNTLVAATHGRGAFTAPIP
jgi:hypothetical protein